MRQGCSTHNERWQGSWTASQRLQMWAHCQSRMLNHRPCALVFASSSGSQSRTSRRTAFPGSSLDSDWSNTRTFIKSVSQRPRPTYRRTRHLMTARFRMVKCSTERISTKLGIHKELTSLWTHIWLRCYGPRSNELPVFWISFQAQQITNTSCNSRPSLAYRPIDRSFGQPSSCITVDLWSRIDRLLVGQLSLRDVSG